MDKQALSIDYDKLTDVQYDIVSQAKNIAASVTLSDEVNKIPSRYTRQDRIAAISVYVVVGKIRETARIVGMPQDTLYSWTKSEWWFNCIKQANDTNSDLIDTRCTNMINLAFDNVQDRLTGGDYFVDKDQALRRKPMSGKDSSIVFGVMFDKRQISRALPTSINHTTTTHLLDIKAQFDTIAQGRVIEHKVSD